MHLLFSQYAILELNSLPKHSLFHVNLDNYVGLG